MISTRSSDQWRDGPTLCSSSRNGGTPWTGSPIPLNTTLPIVWVGDFNSDAEGTGITGVPSATATYESIIAAGYADAWSARRALDPGFTCCQTTNLLNPTSTLTERVGPRPDSRPVPSRKRRSWAMRRRTGWRRGCGHPTTPALL
jgi:hypothetical protein